jgi:phage-related protein
VALLPRKRPSSYRRFNGMQQPSSPQDDGPFPEIRDGRRKMAAWRRKTSQRPTRPATGPTQSCSRPASTAGCSRLTSRRCAAAAGPRSETKRTPRSNGFSSARCTSSVLAGEGLPSLHAELAGRLLRAPDGSQPVDDFIEKLSVKRQVALDNQMDRLNMLTPSAPHLPFPHSSQIEGELRELRCHYGRELYRVLYRRSRNLIVLLHIFRKDTGRVPEPEIDVARERWEDFKARMNAERRRPPRAAGHDAP